MIKETDSISIKVVQQLVTNISKSSASLRINMLRAHLDKPKPKIVTVKEFCDFYGIKNYM